MIPEKQTKATEQIQSYQLTKQSVPSCPKNYEELKQEIIKSIIANKLNQINQPQNNDSYQKEGKFLSQEVKNVCDEVEANPIELSKNQDAKKLSSKAKDNQKISSQSSIKSLYQSEGLNSEVQSTHIGTVTRKSSRQTKSRPKLQNQEQSEQLGEYIQNQELSESFLSPKVQYIIWKQSSEEQQKYLAKFQGQSYLHCKWFTKEELKEINIEFNHSILKSMQARMKRTINLKLPQHHYFNPNFTKVDRVLTSAEQITSINHKLATEIRGHWRQSMYIVCSKLLNFMKNNHPYGVHFIDCFTEEHMKIMQTNRLSTLPAVFNTILLGRYQNYSQIWTDLGMAINHFESIYCEPETDMFTVGQTVKEAIVFLYNQWYILSKWRFSYLKLHKIDQAIIEKLSQSQKEVEELPKDVTIKIGEKFFSIKETFCKRNILIQENSTDEPTNITEVLQLDPGEKTFKWIKWIDNTDNNLQQLYEFKYLTQEDLYQLDLNNPIEKIYLVKWKDLSYEDITWQKDSCFKSPEKVEQYQNYNKYPSLEIQKQLQKNIKLQKPLLEFAQRQAEKERCDLKNDKLIKAENQLYFLGIKQLRKVYTQENEPIYKNYKKLKGFQLQSLNWMIRNWHCNRNCILADEMGLGKTIQTISFLHHLYHTEKIVGPFLILAPLTTLHQWRREIEEWTNFNCLMYCDQGSSQVRQIIRGTQFYYASITKTGEIIQSNLPKFQVLLTNYEIFIKDFEILKDIAFQHIVLDQAHRLKNKNSKLTTTLNRLPCCRKLLLTGTPVQNNTRQLWTLLNFIEPHTFWSIQEFEKKYGILESDEQVKEFRQQLKPYLLRRIKQDVETTIPKLSELIISVEMTNEQKKYYRGLLQKNKKQMVRGLNSANFNSISVQLRKCCNHPYLIAPQIEQAIRNNCKNQDEEHQAFMNSSGKIILLLKLLGKFKREGKKVLVFSQFVTLLELIKPFLEAHKFNCQLLKGSLSSTLRHQAITRFNEEANRTDAFLISTKAGGVGINLISASEVIIFDSDWNPQNDIQATARAHRIGQKKQVTVYRLITANSYEAEMFEISSRKLGLDRAIFTGQFFKSGSVINDDDKILNKEEIQTLLKRGVLGFLQNENSNEQYFNQSIEDILEKNTKKIQYSTAQSSFSKTTFKAQQKEGQIHINAPDFWERALRNVQTPLDKLVNKIEHLKEHDTIQKQQKLMIEAYQTTYVFVKQKTINATFNAEDQIKLYRFFKAIQNERSFHKKYRQISGEFIQQIEKPSRRFRVKMQDLYMISPMEPEGEDRSQSNTEQIVDNDEASFEMKNQKEEQLNEKSKDVDHKTISNFDRLCSFCWRPKCTYFCQGLCGKSFHEICWERHNKFSDLLPKREQIREKTLKFQEWIQKVNVNELCGRCQAENYSFECAICFKVGTCDAQMNSHKQKYKKFSNELSGDMVFKCNMRNCHYFFHLKCLFSQQYIGKFADKAGKVVKNIKQKSIIFRCPAHYCSMCYGKEVQFNKSKPTKCEICITTMHLKCMANQQFARLRKSDYVCTNHFSDSRGKQLLQDIKVFFDSKDAVKNATKKILDTHRQSFTDRIKSLKDQRDTYDTKVRQNPLMEDTEMKPQVLQEKCIQKLSNGKQDYSYKDFGVAPITQFDFYTYKGNWCRYCGSRFSQLFKKGPWGRNKLCYHHYVSWRKKKLDLSSHKKQPKEPIDKGRDTQLKYLNLMQEEFKLRPIQTVLRLKQIMVQHQMAEELKNKRILQQEHKTAGEKNEEAKSEKSDGAS